MISFVAIQLHISYFINLFYRVLVLPRLIGISKKTIGKNLISYFSSFHAVFFVILLQKLEPAPFLGNNILPTIVTVADSFE